MSVVSKLIVRNNGVVPELDANQVHQHGASLRLIDVRQESEYYGELGHIKGSILVTLGPALEQYIKDLKEKDTPIVFICRGGNRSATATLFAKENGVKNSFSMAGGMLRWNDLLLPVEYRGQ